MYYREILQTYSNLYISAVVTLFWLRLMKFWQQEYLQIVLITRNYRAVYQLFNKMYENFYIGITAFDFYLVVWCWAHSCKLGKAILMPGNHCISMQGVYSKSWVSNSENLS